MTKIIHEDGYRYPLIPKKYYAAVMFACKMIRQNGYKNKAIRIAANYYGVDEDELRAHVDARTAAGSRAKAKEREPIKRKWYIVELFYHDNFETFDHNEFRVVSAANADNAVINVQHKRNAESRHSFNLAGFRGDSVYYSGQRVGRFENKKEAEEIAYELEEKYERANNYYCQKQVGMTAEEREIAKRDYDRFYKRVEATLGEEGLEKED